MSPEVTQCLWGRANLFPLNLQTLQEKLGSAEDLFSDPTPLPFHTHHSLLVPAPPSFFSTPSVPKLCLFAPFHRSPLILFH